MRRLFVSILVLAVLVVTLTVAPITTAQEPQRFALVIGNQSYHPSVGRLQNPHNDISVVSAVLQKQGFTVLPPVRDARRSQILGAVRELVARLNGAGAGAIGFVYYSGHGAAEKDTNINYLIPVDATEPGTAAFWDDSLKLDEVLRLLDGARNAAKFVVFDACRNELQLPERTSDKGFIPIREHHGTFIAYSTAPGRVASDRGVRSGPYAAALAAELERSGLDHLNLFQNVKEAVLASTNGAQQPWESNGLGRRVYLTGAPALTAAPASVVSAASSAPTFDPAERAWDRIRDTRSIDVLDAFNKQFGGTVYAALARERQAELRRADAPVKVASPTPAAPPHPAQNTAVAAKEPNCFEAPSDAPDVVIRACSALLAGNPVKAVMERALNRRGLAYSRVQRLKDAIADFDSLIASNQSNAGYFDNRQSVHRAMGQHELALKDASQTIRLSPDRAFGYHSRGNIYFDMGRYSAAIEDFTRAAAAKDAFVYSIYDRGRAHAKLGQYDRAVRDFTAVIEKEPGGAWAYRERGFAYIGLKALDKAQADLQTFLRQEPNEPEAVQALGKIRSNR